jgi:hypothetical protein
MVNVEVGKDDLLKNSDVEVRLLDHYYSYDQHDYISSISLSDEILYYFGKHKLLTEDELDRMYKEGYVKKMSLPFDLLFDKSEKVVKDTKAEYDRRTR